VEDCERASSAAIISNLFVDCPHALASSTFQFCFVRPSTADDCAQHYGAAPVATTAMHINASAQELSSLQMMGPPVGSHSVTTLGLLSCC
jgi:hypothetical protein